MATNRPSVCDNTNFWYDVRGEPDMTKNTSFTLSDHLASFVEKKVAEGRYASASDVVRAALRQLEEREARLDSLRAALVEGENSGVATDFDFDAFLARKRGAASA